MDAVWTATVKPASMARGRLVPLAIRGARAAAPFVVLGVLSVGLFFDRLDERDLWSSHEGRAAQDAQSLLLDQAWGLPKLFCLQADLQKPPLYYWLVAGVAWARGGTVDAWSVRFPAAASGVVCIWLMYAFGAWCGRHRAFIAAFLLATSMHFTWLAHIGRMTCLSLSVAICVTFSYLGIAAFEQEPRGLALVFGVYLAIAAALLLKGPIGLVLPAVVVLAHAAIDRLSRSRPAGISPSQARPLRQRIVDPCAWIGLLVGNPARAFAGFALVPVGQPADQWGVLSSILLEAQRRTWTRKWRPAHSSLVVLLATNGIRLSALEPDPGSRHLVAIPPCLEKRVAGAIQLALGRGNCAGP